MTEHLSASQYFQYLTTPGMADRLRLHEYGGLQQRKAAALCVDHRLRPESHMESQRAASQATGLGMHSKVLHLQWPEHMPKIGQLMEEASISRYSVLHQECKALGISVLLTGHHAGKHASYQPCAHAVETVCIQPCVCSWQHVPQGLCMHLVVP